MKELINITLSKQEFDVILEGLDLAVKQAGLRGGNFIVVAQNLANQLNSITNQESKQEENNGTTQS